MASGGRNDTRDDRDDQDEHDLLIGARNRNHKSLFEDDDEGAREGDYEDDDDEQLAQGVAVYSSNHKHHRQQRVAPGGKGSSPPSAAARHHNRATVATPSATHHHHQQQQQHHHNSHNHNGGGARWLRPARLLAAKLTALSTPLVTARSRSPSGKGAAQRRWLACTHLCLVLTMMLVIVGALVGLWRAPSSLDARQAAFRAPEPVDEELVKRERAYLDTQWLVSKSKCHIPVLDPWHESIKGYVWRQPELNCSEVMANSTETHMAYPSLSYTRDNRLYLLQDASMGLDVLGRGQCCYRLVNRTLEDDDKLVYDPKCVQILEQGMAFDHELVVVECKWPFTYANGHAFVVRRPDDEETLAYRRLAEQMLEPDDHYSVLMLGIDTISRLNGMRQLNSSLATLRGALFGHRALEFVGYNKVGENTFPNLVPLLTGMTPEQLVASCWTQSNYTAESESGDEFLDNCKFLWSYYQQVGYSTYFSEDWPSASTFNYLKPGFKRKPTQVYGRPFTLVRSPFASPKGKMKCQLCQHDQSTAAIDLELLRTFVHEYRAEPYFAYHWINCPQHDDLNGASQIDEHVADFLEAIAQDTYHSNAFVIFFSDHGYRWDNFVSTRIGHYESSLPMMHIVPPKSFVERHPDLYENLKSHRHALVTPFDMFTTLVDLRDLGKRAHTEGDYDYAGRAPMPAGRLASGASRANSRQRWPQPPPMPPHPTVKPAPYQWGDPAEPEWHADTLIEQLEQVNGTNVKRSFSTLSLLRRHSAAELDRSCIDAGVPDNYCVCHEFEATSPGDPAALGASYYFVYVHLYNILKAELGKCHQLELDALLDAKYYDFQRANRTTRQARSPADEDTPTASPDETSLPQLVDEPPTTQAQESTPEATAEPTQPQEPETTTTTEEPPRPTVPGRFAAAAPPTSQPAKKRKKGKLAPHKSEVTSDDDADDHEHDDEHDGDDEEHDEHGSVTVAIDKGTTTTTTMEPNDELVVNEHDFLPNREYEVRIRTKPGGGIFQEVVRFYGDSLDACKAAVERIAGDMSGAQLDAAQKRSKIMNANVHCKFSIHSESVSRLNIYGNQSHCVKSKTELKKVCYCREKPPPSTRAA